MAAPAPTRRTTVPKSKAKTNGHPTGTVFDMDAARAARAEERGDNPGVKLGGVDYELVPELPIEVGELFNTGRMRAGVAQLLVDEDQLDDFMANRLSIQDLSELVEHTYGVNLGG